LSLEETKVGLIFIVNKGVDVKRVKTIKYLGLVVDNSLSWKENSNTVVKKIVFTVEGKLRL